MKARGIIFLILLMASPTLAQPGVPRPLTFNDYKTTADYVRDCGGPTVSQFGCMAGLALVQTAPRHPIYCTPNTASGSSTEGKAKFTALIISLVDWLKQRPEYLNKPYAEGLRAAMIGKYPCDAATQARCTLPDVLPPPFLSREQQAAARLEAGEKTRTMSPDQVRAWRQQQVCDLVTMTEAQKNSLKDRLQARWDALPSAEQDLLLRPGVPVSQRPADQR